MPTLSSQVRSLIQQGRTDSEILQDISSQTQALAGWQRWIPFIRQYGCLPSGAFYRNHPDLFPGRGNRGNRVSVQPDVIAPSVQTIIGNTETNARQNFNEEINRVVSGRANTNDIQIDVEGEEAISTLSSRKFRLDNKRPFGVEMEMLTPLSHSELAQKLSELSGENVHAEGYNHNPRRNWKIVGDGSIRHGSIPQNYVPAELVSPKLKGKKGMESLKKICEALATIGAKVNSSCGLHVHHDCHKSTGETYKELAVNAIVIYSKYSRKFDSIMPVSRRSSYYAAHVSTRELQALKAGQFEGAIGSRYRSVNVHSFWRHGTLEFRQHSASVEYQKVSNWIMITQAVMQKALKIADNNENVWECRFKRDIHKELALGGGLIEWMEERATHFTQAVA